MFTPGTVLSGKWSGETFKIKDRLGEGANGAVYLVYTARGLAALKVCQGAPEVALEWSTLEELAQLPGFPKPMLIDDCEWRGKRHFFYVMEWIPGHPIDVAYRRMNVDSVRCTVDWLKRLDELHRSGKAFCDLKPQNVIVTTHAGDPTVRFVDVGGVTTFGRSVRQFTPTVDRAFWGIGSRTADPQYDLVAVALSLVQLELPPPKDFHRYSPDDRKRWLDKALKKYPGTHRSRVIGDVISGKVVGAVEFAHLWRDACGRERDRAMTVQTSTRRPLATASTKQPTSNHHHRKSVHRDWSEWFMWCSLSLAVVVTGAAWATAIGWVP